jgi:hypothetical protein
MARLTDSMLAPWSFATWAKVLRKSLSEKRTPDASTKSATSLQKEASDHGKVPAPSDGREG